ncbi:MAG: DUF222 domain-containing protein [Aeromicrobium sp.]
MEQVLDTGAQMLDRMTVLQRNIAMLGAALAREMLDFADLRRNESRRHDNPSIARLEASFASDEIGVALRQSTKRVQDQIAQARRVRGSTPSVWACWSRGDIDPFTVWKIDQAASRLTNSLSVAELDDRAGIYAASHTTRQLQGWLNRFVARTEPDKHSARHRFALKDRYVAIDHDPDGVAWIRGLTSTTDAAQVDALLTKMARALGSEDPRTMDQRRADLYADLLLGRIDVKGTNTGRGSGVTIGITVPISTVLGVDDTPGELLDRSAGIPADVVRELCQQRGTLFYRLLTDPAGKLLDVTEMGRHPSARLRYALDARDGQCLFPTCTAPAERSDNDHDTPLPEGPTNGDNLKNLCRRHHRIKTHGIAQTINLDGCYQWRMPNGSIHDCGPMHQPIRRQPDFSCGEAAIRRMFDSADAPP